MVASINTWRFALPITLSINSCTFSCCLLVARTLITPVSGLAITFAANRVLYSERCWLRSSVAAFVASAKETGVAFAPTFCALDSVVEPNRVTITSLSVSANNSLRF